MSGVLTACGDGWCLDGKQLGLGPADQLAREAAHDYDGDLVTETNTDELAGLAAVGRTVTVQVASGSTEVYVLEDEDYRYADGTFA
jgi:hypothetical protein